MAHQQSSDLLRVLGQLDDAAWAASLLPLLRADGSAGAVALACKQLRQLCHGNQREMKLTGANCQHLGPLELDAFSRPFPACSSVVFTASSAKEVGLHLACVVPMIARLPNLQSLHLTINSSSTSRQPDRMAPALQLLRALLPQLRSLQLELAGSWASDSQQAWAVLGATTQLTKLAIDFKNSPADDNDPGLSLQHLSALQPLGSGLRHLGLTAERFEPRSPQDCSFLSSFSALTRLMLPLTSERSGLAAISSCTALQDLQFVAHEGLALDAAECAALAQLTRLTWLRMPSSSDVPALLAALQRLSGLQSLQLQNMSSSHLPVLTSLTKLTRMAGSWVDTPEDQATLAAAGASQHACPSVVEVMLSGPYPLAAFPGAKEVVMCETWQPSRLASLSQHMKALEALCISVTTDAGTFRSLDPSAQEAERVAAVRSLGQLAQLTELQIALNDDAEAAALATAGTQLKELFLFVPRGSSVTAMGLSSCFCRPGKLHVFDIRLYGLHFLQSQAQKLLQGLSGVRELLVAIEKWEQQEVWEAAAAALRAAGVALPAVCAFHVDDDDVDEDSE